MKKIKILSAILVIAMLGAMLVSCSSVKKVEINTPEDLVGKKIAVQEGTTGDIYVTDEIEGSVVSRFKKAVDTGVDLKNGRVDAVVLDKLPAQKIVDKNKELKILPIDLSVEEYAIAVKKGNLQLVKSINETLAKIKTNGTYEAIRAVYMPEDATNIPALPTVEPYTATKKIVMGTNAEFEPFEFRDDSGKIAGFDIEVAKQIAKDLGYELVIEDMAFDSLIPALASGKIDFIIAGMSVTEERKQNVEFSDAYFNATQVIIVRK